MNVYYFLVRSKCGNYDFRVKNRNVNLLRQKMEFLQRKGYEIIKGIGVLK